MSDDAFLQKSKSKTDVNDRDLDFHPEVLQENNDRLLYCAGHCNGVIPAVAAARCKSSADLLTIGTHLVCLNLRLMLVLVERCLAIEMQRGLRL